MRFIKNFFNLISFLQTPKKNKKIVFYSEGPAYWVHLKGLIINLLEISNLHLCFITSSNKDEGLNFCHKNFKAFEIGSGAIRNWLFENIETDVMVMTTPDLNNFQLKRSKNKVNYVYIQHSLVSLHMIYRDKAFNHFDTIFCSGPHHVKEINELIKKYKLSSKKIIKHGYGRLDEIIRESINTKYHKPNDQIKILIAPSWGKNGIIETMGEKIVDVLIDSGFKISLRPHPQTVKNSSNILNQITTKYKKNDNFKYEIDMGNNQSLFDSDLMITDWSGAALEYAFGLQKPIIFLDVPKKIHNANYENIPIIPIEVSIREKLGLIVKPENIINLNSKINFLLKNHNKKNLNKIRAQTVFNLGKSDHVGAIELLKLVKNS